MIALGVWGVMGFLAASGQGNAVNNGPSCTTAGSTCITVSPEVQFEVAFYLMAASFGLVLIVRKLRRALTKISPQIPSPRGAKDA